MKFLHIDDFNACRHIMSILQNRMHKLTHQECVRNVLDNPIKTCKGVYKNGLRLLREGVWLMVVYKTFTCRDIATTPLQPCDQAFAETCR